jgi:2-oxoisovalerate dehydrogenase E1 component alpha subunit
MSASNGRWAIPSRASRDHLIALGEWSAEQHEALKRTLADEVKAATKEAEKNGILGHGLHHPFHTMFEDVFEELPWHLEEQATQAIRERRIKWPDWKEDEA